METVLIPCPQCGRELRLRDRSLLGRKGKCPKCGHRFVLSEPEEEVELELVDSTPSSRKAPAEPSAGTSARWVPEEDPAASQAQAAAGSSAPRADHPPGPVLPIPEAEGDGVSQLQALKRKRGRQTRVIAAVVGAVTALGLVIVLALTMNFAPEEPAREPPRTDADFQAEKRNLEENLELAQSVSPTRGEPIELLYVPSGARIVIHLRPSALWREGSTLEEMRYGLGPGINSWAEERLQELCLFEPAEIEEATICLLLGARGTPPEIASVVRLAEKQKKSELISRFQAERNDSFGRPVYLNDERCYMVLDLKTFAMGPRGAAAEMVDAIALPQPTDTDIEALIHHTDRRRHLTVLFEPFDLRNFQDVLVPQETRDFLNLFLDWLGEDAATVAWSLHLDDQRFYSEMLLRNKKVSTPRRLHREFRRKLDRLPGQVLGAVKKMDPQKLGHRLIIGRMPAMTYAYSESTLGGIGERYLQLTTVLPERAGPNLTAGMTLTWAESLRTDFTKEPPEPSGPKLPERVVDRLKLPVNVEFSRVPLHAAFDFIGEEIKVDFELDGDALKAKGMTQNMAQNHELGEVSAEKAIHAIVSQYSDEGMCIVVDEEAKQVIVTTREACEKTGLKPFPLNP